MDFIQGDDPISGGSRGIALSQPFGHHCFFTLFTDILIYRITDKLQRMMNIVSEKCHRGKKAILKPFNDQIRVLKTWRLGP